MSDQPFDQLPADADTAAMLDAVRRARDLRRKEPGARARARCSEADYLRLKRSGDADPAALREHIGPWNWVMVLTEQGPFGSRPGICHSQKRVAEWMAATVVPELRASGALTPDALLTGDLYAREYGERHPEAPTHHQLVRLFGGWTKLQVAAGLRARALDYSEEDAYGFARRMASGHLGGYGPLIAEYRELRKAHQEYAGAPSDRTISAAFRHRGGWRAFIAGAGLSCRPRNASAA